MDRDRNTLNVSCAQK